MYKRILVPINKMLVVAVTAEQAVDYTKVSRTHLTYLRVQPAWQFKTTRRMMHAPTLGAIAEETAGIVCAVVTRVEVAARVAGEAINHQLDSDMRRVKVPMGRKEHFARWNSGLGDLLCSACLLAAAVIGWLSLGWVAWYMPGLR